MQLRARLHFKLGSRTLKRGELCDVTERLGAVLVARGWAESAAPEMVAVSPPAPATLPEEPALKRAPRKDPPPAPAPPVHEPRPDRTAPCKFCGKNYQEHPKRRGVAIPADSCGGVRAGYRSK